MDVLALTKEINDNTRAALKEEPEAIKRIAHGDIPTDAGIGTQYFSTLVFALVYTLTLGQHMLFHQVDCLNNTNISLEDFKDQLRIFFVHGFKSSSFLGYVLDPKIEEYCETIFNNLDQINDRQQMNDLLSAYCSYINMMHSWLHVRFPWGLGVAFTKAATR